MSSYRQEGSFRKRLRETNSRCGYCGVIPERYEIDHVIPRSRGGTGAARNLLLVCVPCNRKKLDRPPSFLLAHLKLERFYFQYIGLPKGQIRNPDYKAFGGITVFSTIDIDPMAWTGTQ